MTGLLEPDFIGIASLLGGVAMLAQEACIDYRCTFPYRYQGERRLEPP
jgi:hypothetical protein